ncbi:hypothetical protein K9U39_05200 [Rhodoblastus acidophilus]|uniref:Uncharacterized protein n=1 Tax=Candidatus Rhodoblastus alkanivorans TaxID=2954117 RepID=A0ABS9Z5U3_9HYPH|nr:hypothetical protein [Candidatus Rhodoblastus alkanivorans]MCI4678629.1 hypothetical protein [Candidatus Rhodoblastus alkanivorans]MCI4683039.1 hypothetical protein [Candidatus Rhodoblastus alkanivorans]MDI4640349.1 hypothetical protein [Rhodoblastus acidophilus]
MKKFLFALGAIALLAEPVVAMPIQMSTQDAVVGIQPTQTATRAGVAHRSTRRTSRRVNRRHGY